jgi:hypothetical protein
MECEAIPTYQKKIKEIKRRKRLHLSCMGGDNLLCSCCLSKINGIDLGIAPVHLRLSIISRKSQVVIIFIYCNVLVLQVIYEMPFHIEIIYRRKYALFPKVE